MRHLRNISTGVQVTVSDEKAEQLVDSGAYEPDSPPKKTPARTKRTPKPHQE